MSVLIGWVATGLAAVAAAAGTNAAPTASVSLNSVSCAAAQACVAVGAATGPSSQSLLALTLQNQAWQITPTPAIAGSPDLFAVSCPAPGDCVAVGGMAHGPIALRLAGGVLTSMRVPAPDQSATLYGVSCPTANWCMAAGVGHTEKLMFSDILTGHTWRKLATPAIPASILQLTDLSCASTRFCMAVGDSTTFGQRVTVHPVAAIFNGSAWRVLRVTAAGAAPSLRGVSCPAADECVAVGNSNFYSGSPGRQLILRYRARHWMRMTAAGSAGIEPLAISCTAPGACVTVGSISLGAPVVERLAGGAWSNLPTDSPGAPTHVDGGTVYDQTLRSIACAKRGPCVAVGDDNGAPFSELIGPGHATLLPISGP